MTKHMHPSSELNMSVSSLPLLLSLAYQSFISMPKTCSFTAKATSRFTSISHLASKTKHITTPFYFFSNRCMGSNKHHVSGTWRSTTRLSILASYLANSILVFSFPANGTSFLLSTSMIFSWWVLGRNVTNSRFNLADDLTLSTMGMYLHSLESTLNAQMESSASIKSATSIEWRNASEPYHQYLLSYHWIIHCPWWKLILIQWELMIHFAKS